MVLSLGLWLVPLLSGCSYLMASATDRMASNIASAILNQDDPMTVQQGAPAYLLMIDGFIEGDPGNTNLLMTGARLYSSYATVFVDDHDRAQRLSTKARSYGIRALCQNHSQACRIHERPHDEYVQFLDTLTKSDIDVLYNYTTTWASWIQMHKDDWNAVADISKVQASIERVLALDETHDHGGAHLYLGMLSTLLPPALGGKPEVARMHFERAIALSQGRNLMAKVLFAKHYARLVFDRNLHDDTLKSVISTDPHAPGYTLMNILAQKKARQLLETAEQYF